MKPTTPEIFADDKEAIDLLLWAVNLGAVAHNALMAFGAVETPLPSRLIQKMHDLRRALNDPRKHALRMAYLNAWERTGHEVGRSNREARRYEIGPDFQNREIAPSPSTDAVAEGKG